LGQLAEASFQPRAPIDDHHRALQLWETSHPHPWSLPAIAVSDQDLVPGKQANSGEQQRAVAACVADGDLLERPACRHEAHFRLEAAWCLAWFTRIGPRPAKAKTENSGRREQNITAVSNEGKIPRVACLHDAAARKSGQSNASAAV